MEMTARKFNLESRLRKRGRPSNLTYFEEKAPDPFLLVDSVKTKFGHDSAFLFR